MNLPPFHRHHAARGLTLLELVVVLAILAALGGVVLMKIGRDPHEERETATRATLNNIRQACERYFADTNRWPEYMGDLFISPAAVDNTLDPLEWKYDPATRTGWNGPYLHSSGASYPIPVDEWPVDADIASFAGAFAIYERPPTGNPGPPVSPMIRDAWGCPIILQQSIKDDPVHEVESIRLVSAGRDYRLQTPDNPAGGNPSTDYRDDSDDLVLFLRTTDPLPQERP